MFVRLFRHFSVFLPLRTSRDHTRNISKGVSLFIPNRTSQIDTVDDSYISPPKSFLTDSFGRLNNYLRVSLVEKCNLRCRYCMPADGVHLTQKPELLTPQEIHYLLSLFIQAGVTKIRFTGGEPTLCRHLVEHISYAKSRGVHVALTTNGLVLSRKLDALLKAGLDAVNISLDTLVPAKFEYLTRRRGHHFVLRGLYDSVQSSVLKVKLNCVIMRGFNEDELLDFVLLTRHLALEVRFIEYMPFAGNGWSDKKLVPYDELVDKIRSVYPEFTRIKDASLHETSKAWAIPGFRGTVGFITSMSQHFCGSCNRLRLLADGNLKVCLFGNSEVNLRDVLRETGADEAKLLSVIGLAVGRKQFQHAGMMNLANMTNRPMILIGG